MLNLYGSKCGPDGPPKLFKNFSISPSTVGPAGKVLLAFSYTQSTHHHTTVLQFHTTVLLTLLHLIRLTVHSAKRLYDEATHGCMKL